MAKKGKKGKGSKGKKSRKPSSKKPKEEPLSVGEAIIAFQREVKLRTIEAFKEEILHLQIENKESKEKTGKLKQEQLLYVKQAMKAAKDFDSDYQSTIAHLEKNIQDALYKKNTEEKQLQAEEDGMQEEIIRMDERNQEMLRTKAELLEYKNNGSILHKKEIEVLQSTINDLNECFAENVEYIQKNLRLTIDEITKDTACKVDSQKYQATDRAIQKLDPRNYTTAQQNAWLKSEVSLLQNDVAKLWKEVESIETENIAMLGEMYDEKMLDIKRSRQHYFDCISKIDKEEEEELLNAITVGEELGVYEDADVAEANLQTLTIHGEPKPIHESEIDADDDALIAVSSFEWTIDEKMAIALTTV